MALAGSVTASVPATVRSEQPRSRSVPRDPGGRSRYRRDHGRPRRQATRPRRPPEPTAPNDLPFHAAEHLASHRRLRDRSGARFRPARRFDVAWRVLIEELVETDAKDRVVRGHSRTGAPNQLAG